MAIKIASKARMNTDEAAVYMGVPKSFLERDRWLFGKGQQLKVPFIKLGYRTIVYEKSALDQAIAKHRRE